MEAEAEAEAEAEDDKTGLVLTMETEAGTITDIWTLAFRIMASVTRWK